MKKCFCEELEVEENPAEMARYKLDLESRHILFSFNQSHSYNYLNFLPLMSSEQEHIYHIRST